MLRSKKMRARLKRLPSWRANLKNSEPRQKPFHTNLLGEEILRSSSRRYNYPSGKVIVPEKGKREEKGTFVEEEEVPNPKWKKGSGGESDWQHPVTPTSESTSHDVIITIPTQLPPTINPTGLILIAFFLLLPFVPFFHSYHLSSIFIIFFLDFTSWRLSVLEEKNPLLLTCLTEILTSHTRFEKRDANIT